VVVKHFPGIILCALLLAVSGTREVALGAEPGKPAASPATRTQQRDIRIYKYRDRSGVTSFSDQAPDGRRYEILRYDCYACNPASRIDWHSVPLYLKPFRESVARAAGRYGVDPALVRAVIHAESAFRPAAVSSKGALGLMQLMPDTAREMGVTDALSPEENIHGGVRYLAALLRRTGGNTRLATAAYNAGPGAVERHNGVPPYEETRTYVKRVAILHDRYRKALAGARSGKPGSQTSGP
jgi:soluble lytic murein transglycosylase-like protein